MDINEERTKILKEIIYEYRHDVEVLKAIRDGENLADYIKELAVIHPNEYNKLLDFKTSNLDSFIQCMARVHDVVAEKRKWAKLYKDYAYYYLAACTTGDDRLSYKICYGPIFNAVGEDGKIDYTPYLERLGINAIEELHPDLRESSNTYHESASKKEKILVTGLSQKY